MCSISLIFIFSYIQFWAPDDGRRKRLKHAEHFTEINKLCNVASCWLYLKKTFAMHGTMNVKFQFTLYVCPHASAFSKDSPSFNVAAV